MKGIWIHAFGGPEVLRLEDTPSPEPADGEVLVRILAASVNPVDYKIRQGGYPAVGDDKLPLILGRDVAGVVDRVGPGGDAFSVGDEVFAMLPLDRGGYAEFVAVRAEVCARQPEGADAAHAASAPLAGLTAWQGLFDHGGLQAGQTVLIHGAGGGVGHLALQFARASGAIVIATGRGEDHDLLKGLGATEVIDYQSQRFETQVREVDVVFDLVGGQTQERSWDVLKPGGVLVSTLTQPSQEKAAARRARGVRYTAHPDGRQLARIADLVAAGEVTLVIDRTYDLGEAAEAHRRLENEHVQGKIVLVVD